MGDAQQAAAAAEDRLRQLHPDALNRFDELRTSQAPDVALAEVTPLIDPDAVTRTPNSPQSVAASAQAPEVRYAPAVCDALGTEIASKVLRDDAWPALAAALQQAEQLGARPTDLLRQVAGERELASAKSVAEVLHHRLDHRRVEQRTPTAADVASSSYPTALAAARAATRTTQVDPFVAGSGEQAQSERAAGTDPAALDAAVELGRGADAQRQAAQTSAATSDDVSTPRFDEQRAGLNQATVHTDRAAADQSASTVLLAQADTGRTAAASTKSASATASQSHATPIKEVSAAQAVPKSASAAAPAARTAGKAAPTTGRRR